MIPFTEKLIFDNKKRVIYFGTILSSVLLILLILIFKKLPLR